MQGALNFKSHIKLTYFKTEKSEGSFVGYIVKLIPENLYFVPHDNEIGTTEFRSKAVAEGLFYDYAEATAMVKLYNKDMLQDVDYEIELIE